MPHREAVSGGELKAWAWDHGCLEMKMVPKPWLIRTFYTRLPKQTGHEKGKENRQYLQKLTLIGFLWKLKDQVKSSWEEEEVPAM